MQLSSPPQRERENVEEQCVVTNAPTVGQARRRSHSTIMKGNVVIALVLAIFEIGPFGRGNSYYSIEVLDSSSK